MLQNATSSRSLFYYASMIHLAKACGTKVFIYANGIGPLRGRIAEMVVYRTVMKVDRISVRDRLSKETLVRLGVPSARIFVTADPAFRLVYEGMRDVSHIRKMIGMKDGERYFAVSLRSAVCDEGRVRELCRACREIYLGYGMRPVFVSMQESEDKRLCRMIAAETCGEAIVVPYLTAEELCSLLSGMEFVLTMRLHLMIYSAVGGTPVVGISTDPKLYAMADVLGAAETVRADCFGSADITDAVSRVLCADRDRLREVAFGMAQRSDKDAEAAVRMMLK